MFVILMGVFNGLLFVLMFNCDVLCLFDLMLVVFLVCIVLAVCW